MAHGFAHERCTAVVISNLQSLRVQAQEELDRANLETTSQIAFAKRDKEYLRKKGFFVPFGSQSPHLDYSRTPLGIKLKQQIDDAPA